MQSLKSQQKVERIFECSLSLLRESGDHGLTMRQVAARSEMSLSNLQHYFKTKEALLAGLIDFYLQSCVAGVEQQLAGVGSKGAARLKALIGFSIENPEMSPICKVFKEIWAIAERNEKIHEQLMGYYRMFVERLSTELKAIAPDCKPGRIRQAASLVVPLVEGYAITRDALPLDPPAMTALITRQILELIS